MNQNNDYIIFYHDSIARENMFTNLRTSSSYDLSFLVHSECPNSYFCSSDVVCPCLVCENKPSFSSWIFLILAWDDLDWFSIQNNLSGREYHIEFDVREIEIPFSKEKFDGGCWDMSDDLSRNS